MLSVLNKTLKNAHNADVLLFFKKATLSIVEIALMPRSVDVLSIVDCTVTQTTPFRTKWGGGIGVLFSC